MYKVQENFSNAILRSLMDNLHHRLKVELGRKKNFITTIKSILESVELQSLVRNILKYGKYSPAMFASFDTLYITRGKSYHL